MHALQFAEQFLQTSAAASKILGAVQVTHLALLAVKSLHVLQLLAASHAVSQFPLVAALKLKPSAQTVQSDPSALYVMQLLTVPAIQFLVEYFVATSHLVQSSRAVATHNKHIFPVGAVAVHFKHSVKSALTI